MEEVGGLACSSCGTVNPASMNFCKMCGEPLRAQVAQASAAPARAAQAPAPASAAGQSGPRRMALPSALAAVAGNPGAPGGRSKPSPTVVARKPMVSGPGQNAAPAAGAATSPAPATPRALRTCGSCGGTTPAGFAFCQHCGTKLDVAGAGSAETDQLGVVATLSDVGVAETLTAGEPIEVVPLVKKRAAEPARAPWGHLVSVLRDGSDGERHSLVDDAVDIGRSEGALIFDDRFLAGRHARVERRAGASVLAPLEQTNGVYFRLRAGESAVLVDGDAILIGKEVLRFEVVEPEERGQAPAMQHGVRLFGSPVRSPWARLRQIAQSGVARDIYHLVAAEVTLGREEGDLRFSDDEFMSRRHARIVNRDGRFEIVDLESSNGTFVRVRGERQLRQGDLVRMGDQLLRFEPSV